MGSWLVGGGGWKEGFLAYKEGRIGGLFGEGLGGLRESNAEKVSR